MRVSVTSSVRETITTIGANRRQIALVLDSENRLLGVVTDGDIRRGMLNGIDLEASVSEIMNAQPKVGRQGESTPELIKRMAELAIRHIPLLDDSGRVVGLIMADEITTQQKAATPVVLMAGGRGQRLYPLTKEVPKPMLPIGGVPLLEIILRRLSAQGFVNVYISVNYLAEIITDYIGDGRQLGLDVQYVYEDKPLGTAGALSALSGIITEPFIVMNSDLLTHVDLREMLSFHETHGSRATVGVREHVFEIPYGVVNLNGARVESMVEKPLHRSLVNAGIYALDPMALDLLTPGEYCDMPTLIGMVMRGGDDVNAFPIHERWLDVGRPEDLNQAQNDSGMWTRP